MSGLDLDAIEARANAATPGPWAVDPKEPRFVFKPDKPGNLWDGRVIATVPDDEYGLIEEANSEFIAHARTDIPALLARVRELEAAQARLDASCRLLVHSGDLTPVGARQIRKILTERVGCEVDGGPHYFAFLYPITNRVCIDCGQPEGDTA